ncbi:MAG: glycosyltransferase family 2 protein [Acidibacillus sp.]|nr:glycosyltransferase family 2 protein [Acidibacillus sp.]
MDTLIIVPAYNESKNLGKVLQSLISVCSSVADVLVIDDGSQDDTAIVARCFPVTVIIHPWNMGYGTALQTGYRYAVKGSYEYVIQFDGDGQHNPYDVMAIWEALIISDGGYVIGSRSLGDPFYHPGMIKGLAISIFRFLIQLFTNQWITDPTSGIRGLSRKIFTFYAQPNCFPTDFPDADLVVDILLRQQRIVEIPAGNYPRIEGTSMHAGFRPILYMIKVTIRILVVVLRHTLRRGEAF